MHSLDIQIRRILIAFLAVSLASCASQGNYSTRTPIPAGSEINARVTTTTNANPDIGSRGEEALGTAGEGALAGAGAGAVAGAQAGIACGPWVYLCAPGMAIGMAAVGLVVGGVAGSAIGAFTGLPAEKAEALEQGFSEYLNSDDLASDIDTAFDRAMGSKWIRTEGTAHTSLELGIYQLNSEPVNDESISITVVLGMQLRQEPNPDVPAKIYLFEDEQRLFVEDMLANEGANIRSSLRSAFFRLSNQMVILLEQPPSL